MNRWGHYLAAQRTRDRAASAACPRCGQALPAGAPKHLMPVVYDRDGLPMELASSDGYGVPVAPAGFGYDLEVLLDGVPVERVLAFSRPEGWVLRCQTDGRGQVVYNGYGALTERLQGEVSVRRLVRRDVQR